MSIKVVEANKDNLVTKANVLIEANYKLGVVEQKIILCLASNIQPTDSDFKVYTLPVKEFNSLLGLEGSPKYTELRKITKDLMKKVFELHIDNKIIQVAWLSYVAYNQRQGTIDIRFDPFLKPYLLELKREFTSYKLENVIKLKSAYAIRIYELLKQYERLHKRVISVGELRKAIGADEVYPAYGNFKQRVLTPALKEISSNTDIQFKFEEIKKGRKVDKIKFQITSKKADSSTKQMSFFDKQLDEFQSIDFQKAKKTALKIGFKLSEKQYEKWVVFGSEKVQEELDKIVGNKKIKNPIGYINYILNNSKQDETNGLDSESILMQLLPMFQNPREILPTWFIEQRSVQYLQEKNNLNQEEAVEMFKNIKDSLFDILDVQEETPELFEEDIERLAKLKEIQKNYKSWK